MGFGLRLKWDRLNRYRYLRRADDYRAAFLRTKPILKYIGWLGFQNVGDEALYLAFRDELFPDALLQPYDDFSALSCLSGFSNERLNVLGGGTLINVNPYLLALEKIRARGERYVVWGTGVADLGYWSKHPEHSDRGNSERWLSILRDAQYIGVRGPRSAAWLAENGVPGVNVLGDPALSIQPAAKKTPADTGVLGINLGSHDPVSGGDENVFAAVVALIRHALQRGFKVQYFSLHTIDAEIGRVLQAVVASSGFELLPFSASVTETMRQLAGFDYVVGQRLHATILACAQGVPNLSLSYQPKCLDFLESIKQSQLALPTEELTAMGLIERFEWLVQSRERVGNAIVTECNYFRTLQHENASALLTRHKLSGIQGAMP
ncbi:MAG: polysaccharide pyruvyl transferase family protein [Sulfuriferula sp.]